MNGVLHILDAACDGDAVLEASLLADRPGQMICIGPPPRLAGWRGSICKRFQAVSISRLCRGKMAPLAGRPDAPKVFHCWSISAAKRVAELLFNRQAAMVIRLSRPAAKAQLPELAQLCRREPVAVACATASAAQAARRAQLRAPVHFIGPPARPMRLEGDARAALRRRLGLKAGEVAIAAAGPADRSSGHKLAAWAMAILAEAKLPVRLLIEQTGQASRDAAGFAHEAGFGEHVVLTGSDVPLGQLLAAADLAVFLGQETFPAATVAAAMAAGLPIVAGDIPAAGDFFVHGVSALLVCPDRPRDISQAILKAIEQDDLACRLSESARALAADRFNPAATAKSWAGLYAELSARAEQARLGRPGAPGS